MSFQFGKYIHRDIQTVLQDDPKYVYWLLKKMDDNVNKYIHTRDLIKSSPGYIKFPFGKYKNFTIKDVNEVNPNYVKWIYDKFDDGLIKEAIGDYLKYLKEKKDDRLNYLKDIHNKTVAERKVRFANM